MSDPGQMRASDADREQAVASGGHSPFWPVWLLIFPLVFLARNAWRLYGPAPELDRVQAELQRRRHQREHRRRRHAHRRELP